MCGGSPDVDNSGLFFQQSQASRARAEEKARQLRIQEGMRQIAAIFEGGEFAPVTSEIQPIEIPGGAGVERGRPFSSFRAPDPETFERGEGQTFEGLQPVLDQRREALTGFLVPQLDNQFEDARDDLTFALARSGQLTSSTAGDRQGDLSQAFSLNRADIDSQIQGDVASTRSRMNQQRQALESALRASGDQTASTNNALTTATTFRQETPQLSPLGNVFQGLATGIGAAQQGFENGRIRRLATPNPLGGGTGRVVRT